MKQTYKRKENGEFATKHYVSRRQRIDERNGKILAGVMIASIATCFALGVVQIGKWVNHELHMGWERLVAHQVELGDRAWEIAMPQAMAYEEQESFPYVPEVLKDKEDYQWYLGTLVHGKELEEITAVINCENVNWIADKQSDMRYTRNHPEWGVKRGDRERSWGLAQYHVADPTVKVTREQAIDPKFALKKMAEDFKKGKAGNWTCHGLIK